MAGLGAIHDVGESIAQLLQRRRALTTAAGQLAPVPAAETIAHLPLSAISGTSSPAAGLSISCLHLGYSDHTRGRRMVRDPSASHGISLELLYLLAGWSTTADKELALLSWAMLELNRYPLLDRSMLVNPAQWGRDETLQIVPEEATAEELFRIWDALKQRYRVCALFRVRVVRIGYGPGADSAPVVASRMSFEHGDPEEVPQ